MPTPHQNHVIAQSPPPFMRGLLPPQRVSTNLTNQSLNTTAGNKQDNGSAHRSEAKPARTPEGKVKGIIGAAARTAKRMKPRSRTNDAGGKK